MIVLLTCSKKEDKCFLVRSGVGVVLGKEIFLLFAQSHVRVLYSLGSVLKTLPALVYNQSDGKETTYNLVVNVFLRLGSICFRLRRGAVVIG